MGDDPDRREPSRATVYKASSTQSRLIKMRYAPGGVPTQVVGTHLLVRGLLDVDRLRDALIALTRRHPILRTNYALSEADEVLAIVHQDEGAEVFGVAPHSGMSVRLHTRAGRARCR